MGCRHEEGEDKEDLKSYPHENNNVKESKPQNVEAEGNHVLPDYEDYSVLQKT